MDFHRRIELRFAICITKLRPAIQTHREFRFRNLPALCQPDGVYSGHETRTARPRERNLRSGRDTRRFRAHRPSYTIETGPSAGRQFINDTAGSVEHFKL